MTQNPGAAPAHGAQPNAGRYAGRYGAPRRRLGRRAAAILVAAVLAVVVAGVAVFAWSGNVKTATFKDVGFTTPDAWHATEDFQVTKEASQTAYCAVKALNSAFGVVGWKQLEFGPTSGSGMTTTNAHVALRTESLAVSVSVDTCWIAGT
ncbi:DUF4307 domain-containing protein [Sinomonas sp. ASV322]|uniref:DUF4307 domain-containing protein n=1 Tax=Sinomonas sp. ASV322 TaxID=3041920 RepID=UPI0027DB6B78|nr:DUF4307 domain-containing protein [Sinomonas sp. ASV322]MDQ4503665.1 DUF4307 domain-containing protein [Sinomonas sp. ASV322]